MSGRRIKTQIFKNFFTGMVYCYSQDPKWINKNLLNLGLLRLSNSHQMGKNIYIYTHTHTYIYIYELIFLKAEFSCSVVSVSLPPHGMQHTRLPCPSTTPRACSNSCPSSQWYHPAISSSVIPFPFCFQSFPESRSFPMSQFFTSVGLSFELQYQSFQWIFRPDFL